MNPNCPACSADTDACACTVTPTERAEPRTATASASGIGAAPDASEWLIYNEPSAPVSVAIWNRLDALLNSGHRWLGSAIVDDLLPTSTAEMERRGAQLSNGNARACVWGTQYEMGPSAVRAAPPGDGGAG